MYTYKNRNACMHIYVLLDKTLMLLIEIVGMCQHKKFLCLHATYEKAKEILKKTPPVPSDILK